MKLRNAILACVILAVMLLAFAVSIAAQTNPLPDGTNVPADLAQKPFREWQLNLVTVGVALAILGRIYASLRSGGGLVGIWRGIVFGQNAPPDKSKTTDA